jgi:two-component system sensor histidine kinase/response regulator
LTSRDASSGLDPLEPYAIAGTEREAVFDAIAAEASLLTGSPVALLGFLGSDREWLKAAVGWNATALPLASSFAKLFQAEREVVIVPDAAIDRRLSSHPFVIGAPNVRFVAAVPLRDPADRYLGALTVLDRLPRILSTDQRNMMKALGKQAVRELVLRKEMIDRERQVQELRASLEEATDRFRDFFERTPDLVMSISADGRLLHANESVLSTLGFSRDELTRAPLMRVIDPDAREAFRKVFAEVFESGEGRRVETVFVTAGGRRITAEGSLQPKLIDGRPVLARVIFRDISDRTQFEAELGSARDAALEAARLKTQFLTNVSHEIRTPMNGIVGMIDLMLATPLNAEQQDFAFQARSSAEQLLSIVNNVLYVSNLEAGGLAASSVDFDLFRTLQRIVEVMKIAGLGKDLDVSFVYDEQLPPIFRGNQSKIRQVVTNLMDNAIKFTEEGVVLLNVLLQTETETHRVLRFEVRDTGIGIAEEDRLLLFEKFSQVEATSTRRFQGVGLGLATARQLVETMGGLMDVESSPGQGSVFWFSIPFQKNTIGRRPVATSDLDFRGKRVLLFDGSVTSRRVIRHYLETTREMRVETADSNAAALAALRAAARNDPFRILIFDAVRDLDPLAFARQVRNDPTISGTSLIHLIPSSAEVNETAMREAGINAYASKPVGQGELFDAITLAMAHDALPLARTASQKPRDTRSVRAMTQVTPEMRKSIRVLLAEDNFLNRKLTMSQLEKLGYVADSVGNGNEVLEALKRVEYDVILMDCQMPVVDGYSATIEIRRAEWGSSKHVRIVAMTANALEGDREKCLAAGMDDYLSKPTRHDDLDQALQRVFTSKTS